MLRGHLTKTLQSRAGQLDGKRATVSGARRSRHKTFAFELIVDSGYVATRHHQAFGKFVHAQSAGIALQLGHQVKAWQSGAELASQTEPNFVFDAHRA